MPDWLLAITRFDRIDFEVLFSASELYLSSFFSFHCFPCLQVVRRRTSFALLRWNREFRISEPIPYRYL